MIYIYLDFDGVLNNETAKELDQLFRFDQDYGSHFHQDDSVPGTVYHALHKLSVFNVLHFKRALHHLKDLEPRLVITSSWRRTMTFEQMQCLIDRIGIESSWLHSFTEETPESARLGFLERRAFEIRSHMRYYALKMNQIAIIDDMRLFDLKEPEQDRFVHCSSWTGFDPGAAHQLIWMFKPNWKLRSC